MRKRRCETDWEALERATVRTGEWLRDFEYLEAAGRAEATRGLEAALDKVTQRKLAGEFEICEEDDNGQGKQHPEAPPTRTP